MIELMINIHLENGVRIEHPIPDIDEVLDAIGSPKMLLAIGSNDATGSPKIYCKLRRFAAYFMQIFEREQDLLERLAFCGELEEEIENQMIELDSTDVAVNQDEAARALLPDYNGELVLEEEHPEAVEEGFGVSASPMETNEEEKPEKEMREMVPKNRTILVPVPAIPKGVYSMPETFPVKTTEGLPDQFKNQGSHQIMPSSVGFGTLEGWRIRATRMHEQDGKY
ncbi:unnamed protein product [Thelazia callipaeda]|uniref:Uncharacterized protein n=1 Tax=Thelazia callipaeda TaxID=103827 RepID=A0A0N5DAE8_THECL|nr:unnamed protein product [Thelazia callipaeda]